MKPITSVSITWAAIAATTFAVALIANASTPNKRTRALVDDPKLVKRGEYLVQQVGMCIDCHSPRDQTGAFVAGADLTGAPIAFTPSVPMPWASAAPGLAGLPAGWTEDDMVHFLVSGERPNNLPPVRPPMPGYRFNRDDAQAVVAYVHSLGRTTGPAVTQN